MKNIFLPVLLICSVVLTASDIEIHGDFSPHPKLAGLPAKWTVTSNPKGTVDLIIVDGTSYVQLGADEKGSVGIYSVPIRVAAGDRIKVTATITGGAMEFCLFQYGGVKTNSQRSMPSSDNTSSKTHSHVFTIPNDGTTSVRIAFVTRNGTVSTVSAAKAELLEKI